MEQSANVSVGNEEFIIRLAMNCIKIDKGCQDGFTGCRICEQDYSVQWADTAVTQLYKDKIITKKTYNNILKKLYNGHRG